MYLKDSTGGSNVVDLELRKIVALLGISIVRRDATSSRLSKVNIALTVVILLVGIVQICLMVKGH